jgi:hypothetical protein
MTEIRSYRSVFDLERRIYRIDQLKLNPAGVPLRGIIYFLAILAATLFAGILPPIGMFMRVLPWYVHELVLPGAMAALFTLIKVEGRPFHLAALTLFRYALGPRELAGVRRRVSADRHWCLGELLVLPDGSDARLRRLRYTGPGAVLVNAAHVRSAWDPGLFREITRRPNVTLAALPGNSPPARGQVLALTDGVRLEVRE